MLKRLLLVASLLLPLTVSTFALAEGDTQAAVAAPQAQTKTKAAPKSHKAKGSRHQGRKGSRSGRRQGARRSSKSAKLAR